MLEKELMMAAYGQGYLTITRKIKTPKTMKSSPPCPTTAAIVINNFISSNLTMLNAPDYVFFEFYQNHVLENCLAF